MKAKSKKMPMKKGMMHEYEKPGGGMMHESAKKGPMKKGRKK